MRGDHQTAPQRVRVERVDTNVVSGGAYTCGEVEVPCGHNRWRLVVVVDSGVTAGDVAVDVGFVDPDGPPLRRFCQAGSIAWAANGGQLVGELAPVGKAFVRGRVSGYVGGAGLYLRIYLESWAEGL